jgi:hypothetical protein
MPSKDEPPSLFDAQGSPLTVKPVQTNAPKWLSNQIVIGMISVLFATAVGVPYWIGQQRYQARLAAISKTIDETVLAEDDVVGLVGRQLTAYTIFVGAFQDRFSRSQLQERRNEANAIQRDWDRSVHTIELRLHRYFPSNAVAESWYHVKLALGTLDEDAIDIRNEKGSAGRNMGIQKFQDDYSKADQRLRTLTASMNEAIAELRKQHP